MSMLAGLPRADAALDHALQGLGLAHAGHGQEHAPGLENGRHAHGEMARDGVPSRFLNRSPPEMAARVDGVRSTSLVRLLAELPGSLSPTWPL